jgi:branched-chain amino acid transport system substrate-binding protein
LSEEKVSRRRFVATAGGLGVAALAGWATAGYLATKPSGPSLPSGTTATAPGKQTILLGGLFCTSGSAASFGAGIKSGAEVALDAINSELADVGSNIQFQLISADTNTTAEGALKAATSLAETSGVKAFVGPGNSIEVGGIKSYVDANKLVVVCMSSSDAYSVKDYIFRPFVTNHLTAMPVARLMWSEGIRKIASLYRDDSFGSSLNDLTKAEFEKLGGTWKSTKYTVDLPDYASEVATLSSAISGFGADAQTGVFHVTFEADGLNIYQHAATDPVLGKAKWYGTTDSRRDAFLPPAAPQAIGDFLVRVESKGLFPVNPLSKTNRQFNDAFKAKTGHDATGWDTYFWDDTWIMCLSLLETGGKFGESLLKTVPRVAERYYGVTGPTPLDDNGDLRQADFGVWHAAKVNGKYQYDYFKYYSATTGSFSPWIPGVFMT